VTLATDSIAGGFTLKLINSAAVVSTAKSLQATGAFPQASAPPAIVAARLATALTLDGSSIGRSLRATGQGEWSAIEDRNAARVALAYGIAGFCYGLSGLFAAFVTGAVDPVSGGVSMVDVYAAVLLGGSALLISVEN
jgi:ribose/xylose/arabinose/galactoside ABC-type transport system permease subunit